MLDEKKTKLQLLEELSELRQRIAELTQVERAQAGNVQQESEKRLRSLFEQTTDALFYFECVPPIPILLPVDDQVVRLYDCILVECNDVWARSLGAARAEEVIGKKLIDLVDAQTGRLDALFRAFVEGGYHIIDGEIVEKVEDGSDHYFLNNGHGIIEKDMLYRVWGTTRDVTAHKTTEQQLRILSSVVEQSTNSIAIIDLDDIVQYANPAFFLHNAFDPEQIIGQPWLSFLSSSTSLRGKYPDIRDAVVGSGRTWVGEFADHLPDGKMIWQEARLFPIKNAKGEISHVVYASTDITHRKLTETALMESEQRYRMLIENIPTVAWISNQDGKTVFISTNVEKVYGFSPDEIVAAGEALWFDRIYSEDRKQVHDAFSRLFSEGREYKVEYRIQRKDNRWIWILDRANVVEEVGGQRYAYGVFSDISESKQAEQALQLYTDRLKILYQINQGILVAQSPEGIAQVSLRWIRQLIPCYRAGVVLLEPSKYKLKLIALEVDGRTEISAGTLLQLDLMGDLEDLIERLNRGQIIIQEHHPTNSTFEVLYREGIRTYAYVPLIYEGELIGSLNLAWKDDFTLSSVQEDIAHEVAAQLSIAIRQTQLRETEQRRRKELELLERISTTLRYTDKLEDLYTILLDEFKSLFSIEAGAILISQAGRMEFALARGSEMLTRQLTHSPKVVDHLSQILFSGQPHFMPEQDLDLRGFSSAAVMPFQSQQTILAGVVLLWKERHEFLEEELHLLNTVAEVAGIAIHRMKVFDTLEQQVADRTRELSALYDVTAVSSRSLNLQEILDQSLKKVLGAMSSEIGIIHLLDETGKSLQLASCQGIDPEVVQDLISLLPQDYALATNVLNQQRAVVVPDLSGDPRAPALAREAVDYSYAGVPIRAKERTLGILSVTGKVGGSYSEEAVSLLTSISDQIGIAIENARLYEQAQQAAVLAERQRLARDLHDSVTQSLYSLNLMAGTGQKLLENDGDGKKIVHMLNRMGATAHQALKEMRLLVYELRPSALEKEGLVGALRQRLEAVEGRAEIKTQLLADDLPRLSPAIEEGLYHIAQEALNNALKHSESDRVAVGVRVIENVIELEIRDYGSGFEIQEPIDNPGMGLISIRERTKILGGEAKITSVLGEGSCVSVRVPIR